MLLPTAAALLVSLLPGTIGQETLNNPVVYEDFADNDVFRGPDDVYYFSASNMHYSPGAPILRSEDLGNWEVIAHSAPSLSWSPKYNMTDGETGYIGGTWASTMRYRESTGLWHWMGCIDFWISYTQESAIESCYYDSGLFIDDDDTLYIVHDNTNVSMTQLSEDGMSPVKTQQIITTPEGFQGLEGNRMYKRNETYYILNDSPGSATLIWKSESPWGPWEYKVLGDNVPSPVDGGGAPHQGSLVETQNGDWYFMSFTWAYPAGRMPVLAPITWGSDGFPKLTLVDGEWGASYPNPLPVSETPSWTGTDKFAGTSLGPDWEWNHNADPAGYKVDDGLTLSTVTVTDDFYHARNTLTHRIHGPQPVGTVEIDITDMADGDHCGLAALRDQSALLAVIRNGTDFSINAIHNLTQDGNNGWATINTGTSVASEPISETKLWLRANIDARATGTKEGTFEYSIDGTEFTELGGPYSLNDEWNFFMGYRYGIFNYATKELGGSIQVTSFTSE
ncbi:hypothetical protein FQN54_009141 [Arachnomyces sp. PD_36]|nr:hypothetical protein FQN54_009141 [Arachnomyces sp. PD_36]